jgi:hypothetical protein
MRRLKYRDDAIGPGGDAVAPSSPETGEGSPAAWEMVEAGRYRPRRIRGSLRGRELG